MQNEKNEKSKKNPILSWKNIFKYLPYAILIALMVLYFNNYFFIKESGNTQYKIDTKNIWIHLTVIYVFLAIFTLIPTMETFLQFVELNPGGDSFEKSKIVDANGIKRLEANFSRIEGTLIFWKNQAEKYRRFHYYCLFWTIPSSILIPIITQNIDKTSGLKILLTTMSTHIAMLLAFHRGFKVEDNFKSFRLGESKFYDTYRRMLDRPDTFGKTQEEKICNYFKQVDEIRKTVRNAETNNLPSVSDEKDV